MIFNAYLFINCQSAHFCYLFNPNTDTTYRKTVGHDVQPGLDTHTENSDRNEPFCVSFRLFCVCSNNLIITFTPTDVSLDSTLLRPPGLNYNHIDVYSKLTELNEVRIWSYIPYNYILACSLALNEERKSREHNKYC